MSFLTTNYSALSDNDYSAMPTGEYEMVIQRVERKTTQNGKEAITFWLVVRNDLTKVPELAEQNGKYANRYVFDDHWKRDINGQYQLDVNNLMYVLQAAGVPEGTNFNSFDDLVNALANKPVRVNVKKEFDDYNQKDTNTVAPWNYSKSKYPVVNHTWKDDTEDNQSQQQQQTTSVPNQQAQDPFQGNGVQQDNIDVPF